MAGLGNRENRVTPEILRAILDEIHFWGHQFAEHARLIRSGVDLEEDAVVKEGQMFGEAYDRLLEALNGLEAPGYGGACVVISENEALTERFRAFKVEIEEGIRDCILKGVIPAELANHILRELDYLMSKIHNVLGGPAATREQLGMDDSGKRVSVIPRMLLPAADGGQLMDITLEELLFWLRISEEHARLAADKFKPLEQTEFTQAAVGFADEFAALRGRVLQAHADVNGYLEEAADLNRRWVDSLHEIDSLIRSCRIPGRQTNFWPALGPHILREQEYFGTVLQALAMARI
ncbi:MAG: DUF2935 domain-containing protein [Bacillota bacterium]